MVDVGAGVGEERDERLVALLDGDEQRRLSRARIYFWTTFRRTPTANAEGAGSGSGGVASERSRVRRVFLSLQTDRGFLGRSPSACSEIFF